MGLGPRHFWVQSTGIDPVPCGLSVEKLSELQGTVKHEQVCGDRDGEGPPGRKDNVDKGPGLGKHSKLKAGGGLVGSLYDPTKYSTPAMPLRCRLA
jgi:hypothetical protein